MCRYKNSAYSPMHNLHPLAVLVYVSTFFIMAMTSTHPAYLFFLFLSVSACLAARGLPPECKGYALMGLCMAVVIIIVNGLMGSYGRTVLFETPAFLLFESRPVTLEALLYGANMALKIALALAVFCFYNAVIDSDGVLYMFSKIAPKSAITAIMTSLALPRLRRDLKRAAFVMSSRGAKLRSKNLLARIRSSYPLWKVLLLSALEGSWDTAEAMHSKAFGTGKRTYYSKDRWRIRDSLTVAFCFAAAAIFITSLIQKRVFYDFYPVLDSLEIQHNLPFALGLSLCFSGPALIEWGWRRWKFLRSRI